MAHLGLSASRRFLSDSGSWCYSDTLLGRFRSGSTAWSWRGVAGSVLLGRRRLRSGAAKHALMYQLMTTVSVLVDDIAGGVEQLGRSIGVPTPRPQSYRSGPGVDAVFMRVHPKYAVAPTFLELVAPGAGDDPGGIPIAAIAARQGGRAVRWHATELAMPEEQLLDLADHLDRIGTPVAFFPPDRRDRFFLGGDPGSSDYEPSADGGLLIEAGRSGHLGLPEDAFTAPADIPADATPETMVRIVAREYLVADLDRTLAAFERNLRWTPTAVLDEDGYRQRDTAVQHASQPRSSSWCNRPVRAWSPPPSTSWDLGRGRSGCRWSTSTQRHGTSTAGTRPSVAANARFFPTPPTPWACRSSSSPPDTG